MTVFWKTIGYVFAAAALGAVAGVAGTDVCKCLIRRHEGTHSVKEKITRTETEIEPDPEPHLHAGAGSQ